MSNLLSSDQSKLVRTLNNTREDFERLAKCYNSYKDPESWPEGFGGTRIFTGEYLEKDLKDQDLTNFFVVDAPDDNEKIVGTCYVGETYNIDNGYYVLILGVDPSYQGQGLGKALLLHTTEFAISKTANLVRLDTWPGNLKAMPLYKRQGYKWRPNTSCTMENFIPQIITNPFIHKVFPSLSESWYKSFRPNITQHPDTEKEGEMLIYEYKFQENTSKSLTVWIDRTIGRICGFHLINDDYDLLIKATTPNSKAYIGFDSFPTTLKIENNSKQEVNLRIGYEFSSKIEIQNDMSNKTNITITQNSSSKLEVIGKFMEDTEELDTIIHPDTLTEEGITFNIEIADTNFDLFVGKIPVVTIKASLTPINYHTIPSHAFDLPISLENLMDNPPKEVTVKVEDGKIIRFLEHEKTGVQLSKYDTLIKFPVEIPSVSTTVDYFSVKVVTDEGKTLSTQIIPLPIFFETKAITYERDRQVFLENKHICLSFYKKPQPNSNEVDIHDKLRKLRVKGFPILLGYPFDEEGSEFYKKQLTHIINESKEGLMLSSSAVSSNKPGLKVTRNIIISNEKPEFQIFWEVENTSEDSMTNLGLRQNSFWWPNQLPAINRVIPFQEGIKKLEIFALPIDLGKDPKALKEGWHVSVYETGSIGLLFDPLQIHELTIGRFHPKIFFKLSGTLTSGEKYISPPSTYVFADSWQVIRKIWLEKYQPSPSHDLEASKKAISHKQIGLRSSSGETIAHGIIHNRKQELFVSIDAFRETVFKGGINLELPKIIPSPLKVILPETKGAQWNKQIDFSHDIKSKVFNGRLTFDSLTRIYDYPVTLVLYDNSKEIIKRRNEEENYYEVDNGLIKFRASEDYRGHIYSLSLNDEPNLLHTGNVKFPEVGPFLWFNKFYGGIGSIIRPVGSWDMEDYNKLKFNPSKVTRGEWQGVRFESEIITYSSKIKGLQVTNEYLTLPDSQLLLIQSRITNHSELTRSFFLQLTGNLETSKSTDDMFYLEDIKSDKGYLTYRMQDWESTVYLEKELYTKWVAYKRSGSKYFVSAILASASLSENMYPYTPNLKVISLSMNANRMKIKPKETMTFQVLYFFTDHLESIPPLVNSNLVDLLT
ncbi:MAG: GNAT family N-acetyltransferase [Candidatus Hodarchaeales archaeon]|jgi:ribosomal protein S18 acetylase RimI-like enzyme